MSRNQGTGSHWFPRFRNHFPLTGTGSPVPFSIEGNREPVGEIDSRNHLAMGVAANSQHDVGTPKTGDVLVVRNVAGTGTRSTTWQVWPCERDNLPFHDPGGG